MNKKAVILLSGGIDSSTALAIAKQEGFDLYALSFDYGQRNDIELNSAREIAQAAGVKEHKIFNIDLETFGGSALTADSGLPLESEVQTAMSGASGKSNQQGEEKAQKVPVTYVPSRNTIFLSIALAWAEVLGAKDIFIGVNVMDYSGYPDCRPEYVEAFQKLAGLATASGEIGINAPLMHMTKGDIIKKGVSLGLDYSMTKSCYDPGPRGVACGKCESCRIRMKGFQEAGMKDPI